MPPCRPKFAACPFAAVWEYGITLAERNEGEQMNFKVAVCLTASVASALLSFTPAMCADGQIPAKTAMETPELLKVGSAAPGFSCKDANGKKVSLHEFHGKKAVVLYFYPKDETPGCTAEACGFRDSYAPLTKLGAEVIGVSSDSDDSHQAFAKNHQLQFLLVSDKDNSLGERYKVPAFHGTLHARVTYVIDKKGTIRLAYFDLKNGEEHVKQAMSTLQELGQK
jgi:thioredoxin-dependent peroxiredoxin